jgi:hypothetical protein
LEKISGIDFCGVNKKTLRRSFNFEIMFSNFLREKKQVWDNSREDGLDHLGYNITYPTTKFFLFIFTILNQI